MSTPGLRRLRGRRSYLGRWAGAWSVTTATSAFAPTRRENVPEPELAVLSNHAGEVVAYAVGNDMSSRSIEGENPLYLPQAKVYDRSCSIGPAAVLASEVDPLRSEVRMTIERSGEQIFSGKSSVSEMVRDPAELTRVLHSAYPLPVSARLLTVTALVPRRPSHRGPGT